MPKYTSPEIQERKAAVGFEQHPPQCINCNNFEPPDRDIGKSSYCKLNRFAVAPWSICDKWLGRNGETLETKSRP